MSTRSSTSPRRLGRQTLARRRVTTMSRHLAHLLARAQGRAAGERAWIAAYARDLVREARLAEPAADCWRPGAP